MSMVNTHAYKCVQTFMIYRLYTNGNRKEIKYQWQNKTKQNIEPFHQYQRAALQTIS